MQILIEKWNEEPVPDLITWRTVCANCLALVCPIYRTDIWLTGMKCSVRQ
ncbi:hypothetical protein BRPE64_CCDS03750 [Caballeronia insecticola]|uniref:Uncharacterized protein n=1 Tax=Caballeronia insecticola TaxID=758793 RepID=R4WP71_9BURK|nr:hypothetical protein BRPE64_CCDS03750 [Caballeronia insecticola]